MPFIIVSQSWLSCSKFALPFWESRSLLLRPIGESRKFGNAQHPRGLQPLDRGPRILYGVPRPQEIKIKYRFGWILACYCMELSLSDIIYQTVFVMQYRTAVMVSRYRKNSFVIDLVPSCISNVDLLG